MAEVLLRWIKLQALPQNFLKFTIFDFLTFQKNLECYSPAALEV